MSFLKRLLANLRHWLKLALTPQFWLALGPKIKAELPRLMSNLWIFVSFFILLLIFLIKRFVSLLNKTPLRFLVNRLLPLWNKKPRQWLEKLVDKLEAGRASEIRRTRLIELAYQNMNLKRTRSLITIGGMAVGIGAIVFLVSLGYGLERLVINRVARLEELKIADVSPGESTALRLNEEVMEKIKSLEVVEEVVPSISVVGRVNFKNAVADVLAYAVPQKYFALTKIKPQKGKIFESNEIGGSKGKGKVAGVSRELAEGSWKKKIRPNLILFNILPGATALVWEDCHLQSKVLGYTTRLEGGFVGEEFWGSSYQSSGEEGRAGYDARRKISLGKWLRAKLPLFQKTAAGKLMPLLDDQGRQRWEWAWVMEKEVQLVEILPVGEVLGEATASAEATASGTSLTAAEVASESAEATDSAVTFASVVVATDSAGIEIVELQATAAAKKKETVVVDFSQELTGQAVVSTGMLRLFGLTAEEAVGKSFKVSFIIVKSLMPEAEGKMVTEEVEYRILGVLTDDNSPFFYLPLVDLRQAGVNNFSQLRVMVKKEADLAKVRKEIETMGFRTSSTADTVAQIEQLFRNVRLLLATLGLVALAVAVLGMFNTLTVSLLERTREIGGMKAMGMVSREVRDLFLAEAMIMGLSGGVGGIILGWGVGKTFSLLISSIALFKGQGFLNLTYVPPFFIIFIVLASFVVGVFTGLYPARRATKISALNALRYE